MGGRPTRNLVLGGAAAVAVAFLACADSLESLSPFPCADNGTCPSGFYCKTGECLKGYGGSGGGGSGTGGTGGGGTGAKGGGGGVVDSGVDTKGADGGTDAAGSCDPVAQTCGAGQKCDMFCIAGSPSPMMKCTTDSGGTAKHGETCSGSIACAKGNTCLTTSGKSTCRKFCTVESQCPSGKACSLIKVTCSGGDGGAPDGGVPFETKSCAL